MTLFRILVIDSGDGGVYGSTWIAVEEVGDAALVTTFAPMIDDAAAGMLEAAAEGNSVNASIRRM